MDDLYKTDLTDSQWRLIEPHLPEAKPGGRPRTTNLRHVINAIFYQLRTGCQWEMLPKSFPPKLTVYDYFSAWSADGTFDTDFHRPFNRNNLAQPNSTQFMKQ